MAYRIESEVELAREDSGENSGSLHISHSIYGLSNLVRPDRSHQAGGSSFSKYYSSVSFQDWPDISVRGLAVGAGFVPFSTDFMSSAACKGHFWYISFLYISIHLNSITLTWYWRASKMCVLGEEPASDNKASDQRIHEAATSLLFFHETGSVFSSDWATRHCFLTRRAGRAHCPVRFYALNLRGLGHLYHFRFLAIIYLNRNITGFDKDTDEVARFVCLMAVHLSAAVKPGRSQYSAPPAQAGPPCTVQW